MADGSQAFDVRALDATKPILLGYHGGCPDGCGAAYIMNKGLRALFPSASIEVVAISHQAKNFSAVVKDGQVVFSLDISPTEKDLESLRNVERLVILDHHASETEMQAKLVAELPQCMNLSDCGGEHCGASLVLDLVRSVEGLNFDADVVHMLHKMDVFAHELPKHLESDFAPFKAFLTQHGERNVSLELVSQMFERKVECLDRGRTLAAELVQRTDTLAAGLEVVVEHDSYRILHVQQAPECRPVDLMAYQALIDERIDGKPTLVLTQDAKPFPNGLFNVGVRRAGDAADVSKVCGILKTKSPFVSGGGHPFAGGLQAPELVPRDRLLEVFSAAMRELHPTAPAPAGAPVFSGDDAPAPPGPLAPAPATSAPPAPPPVSPPASEQLRQLPAPPTSFGVALNVDSAPTQEDMGVGCPRANQATARPLLQGPSGHDQRQQGASGDEGRQCCCCRF